MMLMMMVLIAVLVVINDSTDDAVDWWKQCGGRYVGYGSLLMMTMTAYCVIKKFAHCFKAFVFFKGESRQLSIYDCACSLHPFDVARGDASMRQIMGQGSYPVWHVFAIATFRICCATHMPEYVTLGQQPNYRIYHWELLVVSIVV